MKTVFSIIVSLCIFIIPAYAQEADEMVFQSAFRELTTHQASQNLPYYTFNKGGMIEVEGSGLLNEEWEEGVVLGIDDKLYKAQLRYDALNDEMQILSGDNKVKALLPSRVKGTRMGDRIFMLHPYLEGRKGMEIGFFEVLSEGEVSLFKRYEAVQQQVAEIHPTMGRKLSDEIEIVIMEDYYYSSRGRPAVELRTSKGAVLDVLSRRRKAVGNFAKQNSLNPRNEEGLIAIFDFYNRKE